MWCFVGGEVQQELSVKQVDEGEITTEGLKLDS